jgi:hypothetical protein
MNRITLLARPGCHLCDDARAVIERVAGDLGVGWEERDITASPQDLCEYWDKIPVTLVDGVQIDFWRVSETRLRAALGERPLPGHGLATGRDVGDFVNRCTKAYRGLAYLGITSADAGSSCPASTGSPNP